MADQKDMSADWWKHIIDYNSLPKDKIEEDKKSSLIIDVVDYLGGLPKKYRSYADLENESFPDLFRNVYENDVSSLYEAIGGTRGSNLYSNLMTAKIQQQEKVLKKRLKEQVAANPMNKKELAKYMVDLIQSTLKSTSGDDVKIVFTGDSSTPDGLADEVNKLLSKNEKAKVKNSTGRKPRVKKVKKEEKPEIVPPSKKRGPRKLK